MSIMTVTQDMFHQTGTQPEDADGLIHYARRIETVKVAAMIQELQNGHMAGRARNRFHVSLRSDGTVDVAAVALTYGGGGHLNAGTCQVGNEEAGSKLEEIVGKITAGAGIISPEAAGASTSPLH